MVDSFGVRMDWVNWVSRGLVGEYLRLVEEEMYLQVMLGGGPAMRGSCLHLMAGDTLVIEGFWVRDDDV